MFKLESPTILRLCDLTEAQISHLNRLLTYVDKRVDHQISRHKNTAIQYKYYKTDQYENKLEELKAQRIQSLLLQDENGYYTYSGLRSWLEQELGESTEVCFGYPEPKNIPWDHPPIHKPRWYQTEAVEKLLQVRHGSVELGTGLGKSLIIALLIKELGLQTVVMAPTLSIATQLLKDLTYLYGSKHVGQFFDGKKTPKQITVAVSRSLTLVDKDTQLWNKFQNTSVFIADESHLCPAETLQQVCLGLFSKTPYRFFLSGTQMRSDGLEKILDGIIGDIQIRLNVRQGVDGGFLSRPKFFILESASGTAYENPDAAKMTRVHLYQNPQVCEQAGKLANKLVAAGRRVLVLVDEVHQFGRLLPHFQYSSRFAHGPLNQDNRDTVPSQYWESDPMKLVGQFDNGDYPILVGTSCIGMGTDIRSVTAIIDLVGGKSETRTRQSVGRGTRLFEGKADCLYFDFDISNIPLLHKHTKARMEIYEDIYGPVTYYTR